MGISLKEAVRAVSEAMVRLLPAKEVNSVAMFFVDHSFGLEPDGVREGWQCFIEHFWSRSYYIVISGTRIRPGPGVSIVRARRP